MYVFLTAFLIKMNRVTRFYFFQSYRKKINILYFLAFLSCSKSVDRPKISGIVIDSTSHVILSDVDIQYIENLDVLDKTTTNSKGVFYFEGKEKASIISLEGKSNEFSLKFQKQGYKTLILEKGSRYGFSTDTLKIDTVRLKHF